MDILRIGNTLLATIKGEDYRKEFDTSKEAVEAYRDLKVKDDEDFALNLFAPLKTSRQVEIEYEYEEAVKKSEEMQDILDFMKDVRTNGHALFEVKENSVYMKGINISMPELLIKNIVEAAEDEDRLNSLIKFWTLCAMNPDPRARHDLFTFLSKGKFTITQSGYFVAYRNAITKTTGNKELEEFVTQSYLKVKRWKKSPKHYFVIEDDSNYNLSKVDSKDSLGNLASLFENISELSGNEYTDAHTGTTSIKIGEPVIISRKECDSNPDRTCSSGLHVATTEFLGGNSYYGSVGLICLINPKNVVAVPDEYTMGKMRVCEYLPIAIAERNENGAIIEVDTTNFELEMVENTEEELEALTNMSSAQLEEYKKHEYLALEIDLKSLMSIREINMGLEEANEIVRLRNL